MSYSDGAWAWPWWAIMVSIGIVNLVVCAIVFKRSLGPKDETDKKYQLPGNNSCFRRVTKTTYSLSNPSLVDTSKVAETREIVKLGCYFSVHSAVARNSIFRTCVPPEQVLLESDHGYNDPPTAIPCRIEWVEHLVGQQLKLDVQVVRTLVWRNLKTIIQQSKTENLFPKGFNAILKEINPNSNLDTFLTY